MSLPTTTGLTWVMRLVRMVAPCRPTCTSFCSMSRCVASSAVWAARASASAYAAKTGHKGIGLGARLLAVLAVTLQKERKAEES